jgi:hypothetical protein
MTDAFPAEEYGTGSRRTPLVDAPAWLKEASRGADRATLAPAERAFLDNPPSYEGDDEAAPSLAPPPTYAPSTTRRVLSMLLFVLITSSACAVLGLAILRMLGRFALP